MKHILIALDYNSNSNHIARIGHELATTLNAKTTLLHIVSDESYYAPMHIDPIMGSVGSFDYAAFADVIDKNGISNAAHYYLEDIKSELKDDTIRLLVKTGDTADEIIASAIAESADLIVLGSHSKKWLEKVLVGSVAENVLNHSKIPMLIIPTKQYRQKHLIFNCED